jgi:hypothetical protein
MVWSIAANHHTDMLLDYFGYIKSRHVGIVDDRLLHSPDHLGKSIQTTSGVETQLRMARVVSRRHQTCVWGLIKLTGIKCYRERLDWF